MAGEKELKILLTASGGDQAAAEVAKVTEATQEAGAAAAVVDRQAGAVAAVADGAPAAAADVERVAEALKGTGVEALGLDDKLANARARLAELRAAASEAGGPDGLGKVAASKQGLEDLFPTFSKAGDALDEYGMKAVELAGGPIGLLTAGLGALVAMIADTRQEISRMLDDAEKAGEKAVETAAKIREATMTPEERAQAAQPGRAEEFRELARGQGERLTELQSAIATIRDANATPADLLRALGSEENIRGALNATNPAAFQSVQSDRPELLPSQQLARNDLLRAGVAGELTREIQTLERQALRNLDRFERAQDAGGAAGGEAIGLAREAETLAREFAGRGSGNSEVVASLNKVTDLLRDGLQGDELKQVAEIVGSLAEQVRIGRESDRAAIDALRAEVATVAAQVANAPSR